MDSLDKGRLVFVEIEPYRPMKVPGPIARRPVNIPRCGNGHAFRKERTKVRYFNWEPRFLTLKADAVTFMPDPLARSCGGERTCFLGPFVEDNLRHQVQHG